MRKSQGFRLGRKVVRLWKWVLLKKPTDTTRGYLRLNPSDRVKNKTMTMKICNWGRCLKKRFCPWRLQTSNKTMTQSLFDENHVAVPKGHLAVYVGQKDDDTHRYLVPVFYFNHPLFGELLRDAEEEFGFQQSGGITIPCPISEFESVQTRIAGERGRKLTHWLRSS